MVKPLSFKGDGPARKKRKHAVQPSSPSAAEPHNTSTSTPATIDDDDTWVPADVASDLAGPVLLILPPPSSVASAPSSDTPAPLICLACDANGEVFSSPLKPAAGDADSNAALQPHDVRQVWVANRVAGTDEGVVSLKGHHGKYLSANQYGALSARREAMSFEEQFTFLPATSTPSDASALPPPKPGDAADNAPTVAAVATDIPGAFHLRTARDAFLAAPAPPAKCSASASASAALAIRADAEDTAGAAAVRVRMQARFKPRVQAAKRESKAKERVSRQELERMVGRRLEDDEVRGLKRARKEGNWHEAVLDARVGGKHDKYA